MGASSSASVSSKILSKTMKTGFSDIIETGGAEMAIELGTFASTEIAVDSTGVGIVLGLALGAA